MRPTAFNPRGWIYFSLFILVATLAGMVILLTDPYLWFEEAAQFFLSLGIDHWSPPFTERRGFSDILAQNNQHLFDPVGYTLLLRAWQEVSTAATWLRTLSFIGFLGMVATGYRVLCYSHVPKQEALLLVSLFASSPLLYQYAAELRPYSYEAWGTLFALQVLYKYTPQRSAWWKLKTGLFMAFFLWMRYPFGIAAAITGGMIFFKILSRRDRSLWPHYLIYLFPQVISAGLIYWFCIRLQPVSSSLPAYAQINNLRYGIDFLKHPWTLFYYSAVLSLLLVFPFRERFQYPIHLGRFTFFTVLLFGLWNALSVLGNISSNPNERWAIGLNTMAIMCFLMLLTTLFSKTPVRYKPLAYGLLGVLSLCRPALMTWRGMQKNPVYFRGFSFKAELATQARANKEKIWCGSGSTPEVKYLYEYGSLRTQQKAAGYPERFVLLNRQNEFDSLNSLPVAQKVLWIDSPVRYTHNGHFESQRLAPGSLFFYLWRVD